MAQPRIQTTVRLQEPDAARLARLVEATGTNQTAVIQAALQEYERHQLHLRDAVQHAVLDLAATLYPDQTDTQSQKQALQALATLIGSHPAAEGIALALRKVITHTMKG